MVRTGLSVLVEDRPGLLAGRRVGLVSHAAAVLPDLTGMPVDLSFRLPLRGVGEEEP